MSASPAPATPGAPTAAAIAEGVQRGLSHPVAAVAESLHRAQDTAEYGAFVYLRGEEALAEAAALVRHPDLSRLPLAGVPVAVKDVVRVRGWPCRGGSRATSAQPATIDDQVVTRLRAAGAVVIGATRTCEATLWPMSDEPGSVVRAPANPAYNAGGSSGGSAVAVATGVVPLAHGTDAMGSIRIPASSCGVLGLKPGRAVVEPWSDSPARWFGVSEHGLMGRCARDLALGLGVLSGGAWTHVPSTAIEGVRVGAATSFPGVGRVPPETLAAIEDAAAGLGAAGASVHRQRLGAGLRHGLTGLSTWLRGAETTLEAATDPSALQPRTRRAARLSRLMRRLVEPYDPHAFPAAVHALFGDADVLVLPVTGRQPSRALEWSARGLTANLVEALAVSGGYCSPFNLGGFPALSVPTPHRTPEGIPVGVQLAARPGGEGLLLDLAHALGH